MSRPRRNTALKIATDDSVPSGAYTLELASEDAIFSGGHTPLNLPPRTLSSVERTPSLSVVVTRALSIEHSVAVVSASTCACYCLATSGRYGTKKKKARAMCAFQQREGKSPDLYPFFDPIIVGLTPQKCWDDTSQHDVQSA